MHTADLLDQLSDLARAADLEVRPIGRAGPGERESSRAGLGISRCSQMPITIASGGKQGTR